MRATKYTGIVLATMAATLFTTGALADDATSMATAPTTVANADATNSGNSCTGKKTDGSSSSATSDATTGNAGNAGTDTSGSSTTTTTPPAQQ